MRRVVYLIFVWILSGSLAVSYARSDDSRERIDDYFLKILMSHSQLLDLQKFKELIKGSDLNYENKAGFPDILYRLGNIAILARSIPRVQVDKYMKDLLDELVKGGMKINSKCSQCVYSAISENMGNYLEALMQYGCDLRKINMGTIDKPEMVNAIDLADKWGHDDLVEIFKKHGSKTQPENIRVQLRLVGGAARIDKSQIIDAVRKGAQINAPDMFGKTALQELLESIDIFTEKGIVALQLLLDLGASPNLRYKDEYPLYSFIDKQSFGCRSNRCNGYDSIIINMLIKAGALVSSKNGFLARTPLHAAAKMNYYEAARILVESGVKVMVRDKAGMTPLDLTESGEIIKLLKNNGAVESGL